MKSLLSKFHSSKPKIQWDSEGLDKKSLRRKIIYDLDNLNMNDTIDFLRIFLKTNRFYSTKSFIMFLLKEADLLSYHRIYDKKMARRLSRIQTKLKNEGLIKPFNSQVYRIDGNEL